jgi:hypothetical protein
MAPTVGRLRAAWRLMILAPLANWVAGLPLAHPRPVVGIIRRCRLGRHPARRVNAIAAAGCFLPPPLLGMKEHGKPKINRRARSDPGAAHQE